MRIFSIVLLVCSSAVAACDDPGGPPGEGTLVVFTQTGGEAPDPDGYRLAVDDQDTLALTPSGTAELALGAGAHDLRLLGVAAHCSVEPGMRLTVEVATDTRTPVAFAIDCPATGVRISTATTGLDPDGDGYGVSVGGIGRGGVPANGSALIRLPAGEAIVTLTGLASNCALAGEPTRTITIPDREVVPLELEVVCTAASGVIGVSIEATGVDLDGVYVAQVDGDTHLVNLPGPTYLIGVAPGDRLVALVPPSNCTVESEPQPVTVTAGTLERDTVRVRFAVSCETRHATLRLTVTTSGTPPGHDYTVYGCQGGGFYCEWYPETLGTVDPNGTFVVELFPDTYEIWLSDVPAACALPAAVSFSLEQRQLLDIALAVSCP